VDKRPGAKVYGGTVNQDGRLVLRVTATGEATALAQIIAVVERAQNSRADIQKLGDKVSSVFVPVVILIALATAFWWGLAPESARRAHEFLAPFLWHGWVPEAALAAAFIQAAAVLIVACPCAMGLATPVAIMAGTNVAARRGILIRDGSALEKSGRITAVLFDKTGTLTEGKLAVAATEDLRDASTRTISLPQLAASLARPSNHPLSQAIALGVHPSGCLEDGALQPDTLKRGHPTGIVAPELADWKELRGLGVQARAGQAVLRLGSLAWLREGGVDLADGAAFTARWAAQGATVLGLAEDQRLAGLFALRDKLKPGARAVVEQLRRDGQRVYLVSGDSRATTASLGAQAGIAAESIFAEVRPERKAALVRELQQRGERVAFVGDGINDAPALEQADLGIAVARASDVAREAADLILLKSDIHAIPEALGLAQATLRTIKQNLFWAFFYNAAAVPLAALGFLNPVLCAAAMGLSDLIVIGNALRLRRWRNPAG
jgi:Cu+-exporting ATPase